MVKAPNKTSDFFANKNYRNSDVDLANDSNELGGIPADEYALKKWVNQVFENYVTQFNIDIDSKNIELEKTLKAYIEKSLETQATNNANLYATKNDLSALEEKLRNELKKYSNDNLNTANNYTDTAISNLNQTINNSLTVLNQYVNDELEKLFTSVSNGKKLIAEAITDKGVVTSADDTFSNMANNINEIDSGSSGGGADLSLASTLSTDDIAYGKKAYGKNGLITGNHTDKVPTYRNRYFRCYSLFK